MLVLLLLVLAAVVRPATAAAPAALVLQGSRTASTDITLRSATTFDLLHVTTTGRGRFVGFYVETLDRPASQRDQDGTFTGVVQLRDVHEPGEAGIQMSLGSSVSPTLPAGHYRVYLLADGPARVSVPIKGVGGLSLRPTRAERAAVAADPDILKSRIQAANRQRLNVAGARSIDFSVVLMGRFRAFVGDFAACLTKPEGECGDVAGIDGAWTGWIVSPLAETSFAFAIIYLPGLVKQGAYDGVQQVTDAAMLQFASGGAFTLTLR